MDIYVCVPLCFNVHYKSEMTYGPIPGQSLERCSASASKDQENLDLVRKVESLKAAHEEALKDNSETLKIYAELNKAQRKLIQENK